MKRYITQMMVCAVALVLAASPLRAFAQTPTPKPPSDSELKAAKAVTSLPDVKAALGAAADFMKKYPASTLIKPMANDLAAKISQLNAPAQQLAYCDTFRSTFKSPDVSDVILPLVVDLDANNEKTVDDAFKVGADYLTRNPNDVAVMTRLALVGVDQAKHKNTKHLAESQTYATTTIALLDAPQKPESVDQAVFDEYKTKWLAPLHQASGIASYLSNKPDDAMGHFVKASTIDPKDPTTYLLMGEIANQQYQTLVDQAKALPPAEATDAVQKAQKKMDEVIDYDAHFVALSEGSEPLKTSHDQVLDELTKYYTYRHKGTTGLQELINKYKIAK